MTSVEDVLRADEGVQDMAALYAALNDWYHNIHPERKGVRACERVTRIRDDGLVPTAQRYFEYVASENDHEFDGDAEELLQEWADEYRPDYVERADDHNWDDFGRGLTRALLDGENRISRVALNIGIDVNNSTINIRDEDELPTALQDEFDDLWRDWFRRLDDLHWNRRNRVYKRLVKQMEDGIVESEDKMWDRRLDRYPELPVGTVIDGEKVF